MGKVCYEKEKKFVHGLGVTPQCKALIFCPGEEEGRAAFVSCWLYVLERFKLHLLKTRPAKCATVFAFLSWNLKKIQQKNYQNLPILKQMQIELYTANLQLAVVCCSPQPDSDDNLKLTEFVLILSQLRTTKRVYNLMCNSSEEAKVWVEKLQSMNVWRSFCSRRCANDFFISSSEEESVYQYGIDELPIVYLESWIMTGEA